MLTFTYLLLSAVTWKTLYTAQPHYLLELIAHYLLSRSLHSSNTNLLAIPYGTISNVSSRAFIVSAPSTWNFYLNTFAVSTNYQPSSVN